MVSLTSGVDGQFVTPPYCHVTDEWPVFDTTSMQRYWRMTSFYTPHRSHVMRNRTFWYSTYLTAARLSRDGSIFLTFQLSLDRGFGAGVTPLFTFTRTREHHYEEGSVSLVCCWIWRYSCTLDKRPPTSPTILVCEKWVIRQEALNLPKLSFVLRSYSNAL